MTNNDKKIQDNKDFWNVKKAGQRLQWRMQPNEKGEYNTFKVNEDDFKALNSILGMCNRIQNLDTSNNVLFEKLLIRFIVQEIRHHGTTIFDSNLLREVKTILSYPLAAFYTAFMNDLHFNQLNRLSTDKTEEEKQLTIKKFQEAKEKYNFDYIVKKMTITKNELLISINK
jgi:hypothetical protein